MIIDSLNFIFIAFIFSLLLKKIKSNLFPTPALYILIGVIVGPLLFSWITPSKTTAFFAESTVVLMLFSAGYNIKWQNLFKAIIPGFLVGLMGMIISFTLGTLIVVSITKNIDEALYVGAAMSATSIGLSIPLLARYKLLNSKAGQIVLAAAIVDDVLALFLLSVLHTTLMPGNGLIYITKSLAISMLSLIFVVVGVSVLNNSLLGRITDTHKTIRRGLILFIIGACALITRQFDLSAAVGAFVVGATMSFPLRDTRSPDENFFQNISDLLSPLFFINIGLQITNLDIGSIHMALLGTLILIAAIIGKLLSPWILINSTTAHERNIIGWSLVPRAEVAIVIASIGMQQGHLGQHSMISIILMTIFTAMLSSVVMSFLAKKNAFPK
jgi:Kef-type K+ transport system membrane component KefB